MNPLYGLGIYLFGIGTGVFLVRYGLGLGVKVVHKIRNDEPLNGDKILPTEQDYTSDELEEA